MKAGSAHHYMVFSALAEGWWKVEGKDAEDKDAENKDAEDKDAEDGNRQSTL